MPRAPKHCGINGCTTIVRAGTHCPQHRHGWGKGNPRTSTSAHRRWRITVLDNCRHRCQIQYPDICTGTATIADHITATAFGGAEHDPTNGQGACAPCHRRKTAGEGNRAQGNLRELL